MSTTMSLSAEAPLALLSVTALARAVTVSDHENSSSFIIATKLSSRHRPRYRVWKSRFAPHQPALTYPRSHH